ncbi:hypothetical protein GUJ93_ZPchr0008g12013 [Zizania palustris]|uniref:HMA domain-containing protein n=1 Tax=Zizania palustris TaxID=103762 RepID=A0A8J5UVY6_ZIZPA|nr:hypothetical protein GUJ93_ZPchr0008g12013 [Zizania palustris]
MSKKTVIHCDLISPGCVADIMSAVAPVFGINSMAIDEEKQTLTVLGAVDPVKLAHKLKCNKLAAQIVSVEDDKPKEKEKEKPKEKDPCECLQECVKMCMESCYSSPCTLPDCCFYKACGTAPYGYVGLCKLQGRAFFHCNSFSVLLAGLSDRRFRDRAGNNVEAVRSWQRLPISRHLDACLDLLSNWAKKKRKKAVAHTQPNLSSA